MEMVVVLLLSDIFLMPGCIYIHPWGGEHLFDVPVYFTPSAHVPIGLPAHVPIDISGTRSH